MREALETIDRGLLAAGRWLGRGWARLTTLGTDTLAGLLMACAAVLVIIDGLSSASALRIIDALLSAWLGYIWGSQSGELLLRESHARPQCFWMSLRFCRLVSLTFPALSAAVGDFVRHPWWAWATTAPSIAAYVYNARIPRAPVEARLPQENPT